MRKLAGVALLLGMVACDATAIRLLIVGEQRVPDDVDELVVLVQGDDAEASSRHALAGEGGAVDESLTLLPGERIHDDVRVTVDGLRRDAVVARGHVEAEFRDGAVEEARVTLLDFVAGGDAGPGPPDGGPPPPDAGSSGDCADGDGDGYGDGAGCLGFDCDDDAVSVHPGEAESCNDVDDDCDFAIDEGCPCSLAQNHSCGTLRGVCSLGWQTCGTGSWSECDGATLPRLEVCNGDDDDCDGDTDEGCP